MLYLLLASRASLEEKRCIAWSIPEDKSAIHRLIMADMSQIVKASGELVYIQMTYCMFFAPPGSGFSSFPWDPSPESSHPRYLAPWDWVVMTTSKASSSYFGEFDFDCLAGIVHTKEGTENWPMEAMK